MPDIIPCALCGRSFAERELTKHHCLPREKGGTRDHVELVCAQCHGMVHATFTNETLAKVYPTMEQLRQAEALQKYIKWARKQSPSRRKRSHPRRRKL
jgi:hypothetical protein